MGVYGSHFSELCEAFDAAFSKEEQEYIACIVQESVEQSIVEITEDSDHELFNFIKNLSNGR